MNNLKKQLIRLGNTNPTLRNHIRPVLESLREKTSGIIGRLMAAGTWTSNPILVDLILSDLKKRDIRGAKTILDSAARDIKSVSDWLDNADKEDLTEFIQRLEKLK